MFAVCLGVVLAVLTAGQEPADDLESLRSQVRELYATGKYQEVITRIANSRDARQDPELQMVFATAKLQTGAVQAARSTYERLLKDTPTLWVAANNLGVIYYRQRHYSRALLQFAAAASRQPEMEVILNNLAESLQAYRENDPPERPGRPLEQALKDAEELERQWAERKKALGLVLWGIEWVTPEQRIELEKLRLESKAEIERLERQVGYAKFDLERARQDVERYERRRPTPAYANTGVREHWSERDPATGESYTVLLDRALEDVRTYEKKVKQTTNRLETLRKQIPSPTYRGECQLIKIEENWSWLVPNPATQPAERPAEQAVQN
jgi:tetratricopeptide (TPR) repeat protein